MYIYIWCEGATSGQGCDNWVVLTRPLKAKEHPMKQTGLSSMFAPGLVDPGLGQEMKRDEIKV